MPNVNSATALPTRGANEGDLQNESKHDPRSKKCQLTSRCFDHMRFAQKNKRYVDDDDEIT